MSSLLQNRESLRVPEPTLRRLPWYLSNVKLLKQKGERFVSSTQISKEINIDASQIAKDLSYVNISGRTRVGYEVDTLIAVLCFMIQVCVTLGWRMWRPSIIILRWWVRN